MQHFTCSLVPFEVKNFLERYSNLFLEFEYWFYNCRQKRFRQGCESCLATVRRKFSSKHNFLKSINSIHLFCFLRLRAKKNQNLCIKTYGIFLKTTLYFCTGTILGNKCLKTKPILIWTDFNEKEYGCLSKKIGRVEFFQAVRRKLSVTVLKLSINCYSFRLSSGKLRHFWGTRFLWAFKTAIHLSSGPV